jgi:hypothetical protein
MIDQRCLEGRNSKTKRSGKDPERDHVGGKTFAQRHGANPAKRRQRHNSPKRGLTLGREIDDDAGAIGDREPW